MSMQTRGTSRSTLGAGALDASTPTLGKLIVAAVLTAFATLMVLAGPMAAQQTTISGQVRPRFEYRNPFGGETDAFTSMRVRLAADARLEDGLSIFVQMQDVRIWGGETNPLRDFSADNLDLHQGYLRYRAEALPWLTSTVGRMETNFGGQRLVGAIDWTQQAQSFDGLRFDVDAGRSKWSVVAWTINDDTSPSNDEDERLLGTYGTIGDVGPGALDVYWLYHGIDGAMDTGEHALGARYAFSGEIRGRLEGTLETGTRGDVDVSAFMLGARVGKAFSDERFTATLWYDYLSGDDPDTPEVEVFNTFFATNHKFYGFADLFLNMPVHTGGAGLQDVAVKLLWTPWADGALGLDAHSFRAAKQGTFASARFGEELDLTVRHRLTNHLSSTLGFAYVLQGDLLAEIGRLDEDMKWFYLMLNATF
jgi:Alginate export